MMCKYVHLHLASLYRFRLHGKLRKLKYQLSSLTALLFHYDKFERIAIAYDEIKKKKMKETIKRKEKNGSSRREIFEAVNQLVKFTRYEIHQIFGRVSKLDKPYSDREHIVIFFPIIVFDGDMFEVNFNSGEPKLERQNHILLSTHYRCPYFQKVESFTVDVVHRSYFSEFMKMLNKDFYGLREAILQNRTELIERAQDTRKRCETEKRSKARYTLTKT